jgi:hypothetical protein
MRDREVLQIPKGENYGIPPQDEREKTHTENKQPQTIPKPIHNILSGHEGEVSENAYLDTISQHKGRGKAVASSYFFP